MTKICVSILGLSVVFGACFLANTVQGHGMLLNPAGRSSRWRFNKTAPINYDDNGLFCGGFNQQWDVNDGNCGICGDDYSLPKPRPNELGGKFGSGDIVKTFKSGTIIPVGVQITASHLGYFYFELCNLDNSGGESENCFTSLKLGNGNQQAPVKAVGYYPRSVQLPAGVSCNHCVLRMTYRTGNSWGMCSNGIGSLGCGPQETFKSCADISISSPKK